LLDGSPAFDKTRAEGGCRPFPDTAQMVVRAPTAPAQPDRNADFRPSQESHIIRSLALHRVLRCWAELHATRSEQPTSVEPLTAQSAVSRLPSRRLRASRLSDSPATVGA